MSELIPSPRTLLDWCRLTCINYRSVEISNMSTSFRDGLAFCAIIHKHRPDLIDFSSLSKDNVYLNHKLAFQVAETKLGIPALLDPKEMVSTRVPDCLSVISYLSHLYCVFNRTSQADPSGLRSSQVTVSNKRKTPDVLKPLKNSSHLETDRLSSTGPRTVCNLCFKPVHLIQRHLIDGKIFHRSCFRCKLCHSTLLPESYTKGSDAVSFICTDHLTNRKNTHVALKHQTGSTEDRPKRDLHSGYVSLGGLAVSSVPYYTKTTESQDRPVCEAPETQWKERQERSSEVECRDNRDSGVKSMLKTPAPPRPPPPSDEDGSVAGAGKAEAAPVQTDGGIQQETTNTQQPSERSSPCGGVTEGGGRQVPLPGQMSDSSVVPVPAPRTKPSQTTNSSPAGKLSNQSKSPLSSSHSTSATTKTNHPWMTIIHPGPWTQLPPAPPPVPNPRTKSVSVRQGPWFRTKARAPNPFEGNIDEEEAPEPESSVEASRSEEVAVRSDENTQSDVNPLDEAILAERPDSEEAGEAATPDPAGGVSVETSGEPAADTGQINPPHVAENGGTAGSLPDVTEAAAGPDVAPEEGQSYFLPRSLSVPVIMSVHSQGSSLPDSVMGASESVLWQSKSACRENPFDRNPTMIKSKTFQTFPSRRAPAPGHGFPLIKRKVQTDEHVSTEELQTETGEVEKRLEALQHRGVELEKNLRDCRNDKEEERMLMEWFSLLHEKQALVRRDTELVYLTKQQKLEERQADVEYELRCILCKPEMEWSPEDRSQEQQLMDELVAIIEQRNQIISSLDVDRQREREEDELSEATRNNKALQREELKELKKSKGKFKPTKVFKMLNHKAESIKVSMDKKS